MDCKSEGNPDAVEGCEKHSGGCGKAAWTVDGPSELATTAIFSEEFSYAVMMDRMV